MLINLVKHFSFDGYNMNIIIKMSFVLMIVLLGQASYAGEDLSAEERDYISHLTESFCVTVESQLPGTVEYRVLTPKLNDFELDRALNLAIGSLKLQRLLVEYGAKVVLQCPLIEQNDTKVVIEKLAKEQEPMWHYCVGVVAATFAGRFLFDWGRYFWYLYIVNYAAVVAPVVVGFGVPVRSLGGANLPAA
jgi:hypothetical protein